MCLVAFSFCSTDFVKSSDHLVRQASQLPSSVSGTVWVPTSLFPSWTLDRKVLGTHHEAWFGSHTTFVRMEIDRDSLTANEVDRNLYSSSWKQLPEEVRVYRGLYMLL